ncbi:MAG: glycosyl hydrolase family 18 protein [Clostridia bacterium]|nr:glycosyl hydrolase family 18 protein [Clostridia bacterium]
MSRREKKSVKGNWIFKIIVVAIVLLAAIFVIKIAGNYKNNDIVGKVNLIINNSNVTADLRQDVFVDENGVIYIAKEDIENFFDNYIYYDEKYNQIITGSSTKIANMVVGENSATVNSAEVKLKSPVIEKENKYFIPFSELKSVYNVDIEYINNRVVVDSLDRKYQIATVAKDISIKSKPTSLSRTVDKIKAGDAVVISNRKDDLVKSGWKKIRTSNGSLGYVKEDNLGKINTIRDDMVETSKVEGKVSLAWEYFSDYGSAPERSGAMDGVNVVSPTFFRLEQLGKGNVKENVGTAGINYINWAHNNGLKVWAMISNESMLDTTSEIMNDYKLRNKLINNIVNLVVKYNLDGINIDFENMYMEDKAMFNRFLIELEPRLNEMGKVLTVDVTAPDGSETWSMCFDRNTISKVADYIIFMAYDQYGASSNKEGTTAGCDWVEANITKFLGQEGVNPDKLVLAVPFYTRLWKEANGKVSSETVDLKDVDKVIPANVEKKWNDNLKQYYIEYTQNGAVYKMWIEDLKSISAKLDLINKYKLAGAAYWEKDRESPEVWDIVKEKLGN